MAWEWSHTADAVEAVRENIARQSREWLEVVWAEWVAAVPRNRFGDSDLDMRKYLHSRERARSKPTEYLVEFIRERTERQSLCSNGGWVAYCCPFLCDCHALPFDVQSDDDSDNE